MANYHNEPRATAPWSYWSLWQYCGDGKGAQPRSAYPISVANIRKAERNIFRGSQSDLQGFLATTRLGARGRKISPRI